MALAEITARYETAASVEVEVHELPWDAMRAFVGLLRDLRSATEEGVSRKLEDLVDEAFLWNRSLMGSPTPPSAPQLNTFGLADGFRAHHASGIDSHLSKHLLRVADLLQALAASPHPAARCLEGVLSRYGREHPDDPPAAYLATRQEEDAILLRRWLAAEELDADVRRVSELRDAEVRDALILLGPPARYSVSPWCPLPRAALVSGWLVSAPPARHVHILAWPGHPRYDERTSVLFPKSPRPTVTRTGRSDQDGSSGGEDEPVWLPPKPVEAKVRTEASWQHDRDPVEAIGVQLAGEKVAFYAPDEAPLPQVVTWESAGVDIASIKTPRLRAGQALLFRPQRSADDDLYQRADARLAGKLGADAPAAAKAAKEALKRAYEKSPLTEEQLIYELTSRLNDHTYARHIIRALPRPGYIAPERSGAYDALRSVLSMGPDVGGRDYAHLTGLRSACRRAGGDITRDLVDLLHGTSGWQDAVETDGFAELTITEGFGTLEIRVVTAIDTERRRLGRTRVGKLMDAARADGTVVAMTREDGQ